MKRITLIALAAIFFMSCGGPAAPEFQTMKNVKFKAATLKGDVVLKADAIFNNSNAIGVDINSMELEAFVDGNKVADVLQDINATMKPNADFSLPLNVRVPISKVFKDVKSGSLDLMGILKNRGAKVQMKGLINVNFAGIKKAVPFDYEDEYKLQVSF